MDLQKNVKPLSSMQFDCSDPLENYSCTNCNSSFTLKSELLEHLKQGHMSMEFPAEICYRCQKCEFTTFSFLILAKHDIECDPPYQPPCSYSLLTAPLPPDIDVICDQPIHDVVCSLLQKPLCMRSKKEQNDIINYGRPIPIFDMHIATFNPSTSASGCSNSHETGESDTEKSDDSWFNNTASYDSQMMKMYYINHSWLCGSHYLQALFCWPCLLFSKKKNEWTKYGVIDFFQINFHILDHESRNRHIKCAARLERFERKQQIAGISPTISVANHNENVLRNRFLASIFVRAAFLVVKSGRENVIDMFHHMIEFMLLMGEDSTIRMHYDNVKHIFPGDVESLYFDIVSCLTNYVKDHVRHEIATAPFYSIRIDDAFLITGEGECSVIVRFVNSDGQLVERFLGFYEINENVETLFEMIETALRELDYKKKLVGQCYDAGKPSLILDLLQRKIKEEARQALFVYSIEHRFHLLMQQCMKNYSTLDFVWDCNQINKMHYVIMKIVPSWPSSPINLYKTVREKWDELKEALRRIDDDDEDCWYGGAAYHARSLLRDMESIYFTFFICLFSEIFETIRPLSEYLQQQTIEVEKLSKLIQLCYKKIEEMKTEEMFQDLFEETKNKSEYGQENLHLYRKWFFETMDNVLLELDVRFQDMVDMKFLELANSSKFERYSRRFPTALCENLQKYYPDLFLDIASLRSELEMFYQIEIYRGKSVEDIVKLLNQNTFHKTIFEEVYKLFCLILTLPITNVRKKRYLGFIKTCSENSVTDHLEQYLKSSQVHCELLDDIIKSTGFCDDIIDRFADLNSRPVDLIFIN